MTRDLLLLLLPALPLAAAVLLAVLRPAPAVTIRAAVTAAAATALLAAAVLVAAWPAPVRLGALLVADRLGGSLALLTAGVGLVVQVYAARAMRDVRAGSRLLVLAGALTGSGLLVAVAAAPWLLLAGWVLTSAAVVALVGLRRDLPAGRLAQRRTLRRLVVGDLALAGAVSGLLVLVPTATLPVGPATVDTLAAAQLPAAAGVTFSALDLIAVLLVVAGIARSALVPLHRWLPATLAAPTPVSALLHAGVINGAGVLLLRHAALVGASTTAMLLAFVVGVATALLATAVMLVRADTKGALAWSTSGQMGFMVVQIAVGAFGAALFHLLGHGLYKAAAFLGAAGAIPAHRAARHAPHRTVAWRPWPRRLTVVLLPAAAIIAGLGLLQPDLAPAKLVLLVVFAGGTAARLTIGWLRSSPLAPGWSVLALAPVLTGAVTLYLGAVAGMQRAMDGALPASVPAAVGAVPLVATLAVIAVLAGLVVLAPGIRGDRLRSTVFAFLVSTAAPIVPRAAARATRTRRRPAPRPTAAITSTSASAHPTPSPPTPPPPSRCAPDPSEPAGPRTEVPA